MYSQTDIEETRFFDPDEGEKFVLQWSENGEEKRENVDKKSVMLVPTIEWGQIKVFQLKKLLLDCQLLCR